MSKIDERECSKCHNIKPLTEFVRSKNTSSGYISWCKVCHARLSRQTYERNKGKYKTLRAIYHQNNWERIKKASYLRRSPQEHRARMAINNAIAAGRLVRLGCQECGNTKTDFHHTDGYEQTNWFTGIWLCRKHHAALHKMIREQERASANIQAQALTVYFEGVEK